MRQIWNSTGLAAAIFLSGCSAPELLVRFPSHPGGADIAEYSLELHQPSVHTYAPYDLTSLVKIQERPAKVGALLVVLDTDGLKGRTHKEIDANVYGREVIRRLELTIPTADNNIHHFTTSDISISPDQNIRFTKQPLPLGGRRLSQALDQLGEISVQKSGRVAVLVVTHWDRIDQAAEESVMRMRQKHISSNGMEITDNVTQIWSGKQESGICFYAVGVGNMHSSHRLIAPDACGAFWAADAVMQPAEMASMILEILYDRPKDDDGDGVPNYLDQCPMTPAGRTVTSQGCLRFPGINESESRVVK